MSLFNSREYWSTRLGAEEEFDQGGICIANVDNDPNGAAKIVTGSLQGMLRVHMPHQRGYNIEDILLETELEGSILQLAAGNFLGGSGICLAVLHPRKLAVYSLQAVGSSYLQHSKIFEHFLEHTAANMSTGGFGGVTGVEHIAVQSYDGQLTFFEQEALAFSRYLPDFLLPGPLAYAAASHSFITSTASLELVAYKYSVLAAASGAKEQQQGGGGGGGKRVQADWRLVLGESALDIRMGRVTATTRADLPADLLVLAEHTFFIVDLRGQILVQRRLEYHPACCWAFPAGSSDSGTSGPSKSSAAAAVAPENLLVATHTKALLVYKGDSLAWAARLELLPVAVRVAEVDGRQGMIVALDDAGRLTVLYLGSEPPKQSISFAETRQLDYAAMEQETKALMAKIKAAGAAGLDVAAGAAAGAVVAAAAGSASELIIRAQVPSRLDAADRLLGEAGVGPGFSGNSSGSSAVRQLTATLLLSNATNASLQDVCLSVQVPAPVEVLQQPALLPELSPSRKGESVEVQLVLQAPTSSSGTSGIPVANTAKVVASYKTADGELCCSQLTLQLPMSLFCQVIPPVKNAEYKVTLTTNRDAVQLVALFSDMLVQANPAYTEALSRSQSANVMSFQYSSGQDVSILVSKNGGRYRLQADCFQGIWLVMQELARRLTAYFATADTKPAAARPAGDGTAGSGPGAFAITNDEPLPLQDVYELINGHFNMRLSLAAAEAELEQREIQFRSVQKRLLVRYQDKNAAPLNQMDVLMEETYEQIITLADKIESLQHQLLAAGQSLGAGVQLLLLLAMYRFGLSVEDYNILRCCLSPEVVEGAEVSWEEMTEAAMTQLLRTSLARSAKDAAAAVPPLTPTQDTQRLQKHISLVLERLSKGMKLSRTAAAVTQ